MREQPCVPAGKDGIPTARQTVQPILDVDTPKTYDELISKKVTELDENKRAWFTYDRWILGGLAVTSGLMINHQVRRAIMVYEGVFSSMAASGYTAFLSTFGYNTLLIKYPLYYGTLDCPMCASMRGGVFQAISSTIVPLLASVCINTIVGERYRAPEVDIVTKSRGMNILRYWHKKIKPMRGRFWIIGALNAAVGACVAYRQQAIVSDVHMSVTEGEISDLIASNWERHGDLALK